MAAGRSAISSDGSEVAFVTTAMSNLARAEHRRRRSRSATSHAERRTRQRRVRPRHGPTGGRRRNRLPGRCAATEGSELRRRLQRQARRRVRAGKPYALTLRSAPRSAATARRSRGWGRRRQAGARCWRRKARRRTPSRCGGASTTGRSRRRGGSRAGPTRKPGLRREWRDALPRNDPLSATHARARSARIAIWRADERTRRRRR